LAVEDFGDSGHQSFTTNRKAGEVETEITSESIDGLLAGVQKPTLPGDPNRLNNLSMRVSARYPDEDRSISINMDCGYQWYSPRNVRVSVSGVDPGWTRGRAAGLRDLLSEVQAPWWTGRGSATLRVYWAILPLVFVLNASLALTVERHFSVLAFALTWVAITSVSGAGSLYFGSKLNRRYGTQLLLTSDASGRSVDKLGIVSLTVGIAGVIVAVTAIVCLSRPLSGRVVVRSELLTLQPMRC
jgi:hypothetical protein